MVSRALIICTHLRPGRTSRRSRHVLQPVTGLQIAAQLDPARFSVTLYHEDWHGPFDPAAADGAANIVFLTGLQPEFDRMRQLSYVFRRVGTVVVAGGTICSLFPEFAATFFDSVCAGGVEAARALADDYAAGRPLRPIYRAAYLRPLPAPIDHGLWTRAGIRSPVHFLEASRGCSYRCAFCVMPAEAGGHVPYGLTGLATEIDNAINSSPWFSLRRRYPQFGFLDNNFTDDRAHLLAVLDLLARHKRVRGWSAMVTQNILSDHALIARMAAAKCRQLFVGLESFDPEALRRWNKRQNLGRQHRTANGVVADIAHAERAGITIGYGLLFDPRHQTAAAMEAELRTIARTPGLPMPLFLSLVSPLAGTQAFWDDAIAGRLAANLRLRDLDGETIAYNPLADTPEAFAQTIARLFRQPWVITGRMRVFRKTLARIVWARSLNPLRWWLIAASQLHGMLWARAYPSRRKTYMAGENVLDPQYAVHPPDISAVDFARYFAPIRLTDGHGRLLPWLAAYAPKTRAPMQAEPVAPLPVDVVSARTETVG